MQIQVSSTQPIELVRLRPELLKFAQNMEAVLAEHDENKGGYTTSLPHTVLGKLVEEVGEVGEILNAHTNWAEGIFIALDKHASTKLKRECIDVANVAMMLWLAAEWGVANEGDD